MRRFTRSRSSWGAVAITALLLTGCGVSGKTTTNAGPGATGAPTTTTTVPPTTSTTPGSSVPGTAGPTLPGSGDTTEPSIPSSIPLGSAAIRRELIRIYKQSGFTNKEATCVANLIVKQNSGDTFDRNSLDFSKLTSAARKCFGADGVPGGSD